MNVAYLVALYASSPRGPAGWVKLLRLVDPTDDRMREHIAAILDDHQDGTMPGLQLAAWVEFFNQPNDRMRKTTLTLARYATLASGGPFNGPGVRIRHRVYPREEVATRPTSVR